MLRKIEKKNFLSNLVSNSRTSLVFRLFSAKPTKLASPSFIKVYFDLFLDGENPLFVSPTNREEKKSLESFYRPRTVLLTLVSEFTLRCTKRYLKIFWYFAIKLKEIVWMCCLLWANDFVMEIKFRRFTYILV